MMKAKTRAKADQDSIRTPVKSNFEQRPFAAKYESQAFDCEVRLGHTLSRTILHMQPKLVVGPADDKYEREADRVAEQVMRMTPCQQCQVGLDEEDTSRAKPISDQIMYLQREVMGETAHKMQASRQASQLCPALESRIRSLRNSQQPLPESERAFFEPRFGIDFSQVRVHTNAQAAEAARLVNARAFTIGPDVVFGARQYVPGTSTGRRLLAHELVHVLQQRKSNPAMLSALTINGLKSAGEIEADRSANRILDGPLFNSLLQTRYTSLQRNVNASIGREPSPFQQNARVCLVHLHANEQNALDAARSVRNDFCGNLVYVNNTTGHRCVEISGLDGQRNRTCTADPNRIFSTDPNVTDTNAFRNPCRCPEDLRINAIPELHSFASNLMTAINACRQGAQGNLPVVAFHNNLSFSIQEYQSRGSEAWATATVGEIRSLASARGLTARLRTLESRLPGGHIQNPIIQSQSRPSGISIEEWRRSPGFAHNFLVTTQLEDFLSISEAGLSNVVLQTRQNIVAPTGRDDGSLSIALGGERYINIEVFGKQRNADIVAFNQRMATDALTRLGISPGPCVVQPTSTSSFQSPDVMMQNDRLVSEARSQYWDARPQRDTNPSNTKTEDLRGPYSSDQSTLVASRDWKEHIRPRLACNQLIQRRIMIGSETDQHEMDEQERNSFIRSVRDGRLDIGSQAHRELLISQPQLTEEFLANMANAIENHRFSNDTELVAQLASMIMPRYLLGQFTPSGDEWQQVTLAGGRSSYLRREIAAAFRLMQQAARRAGHNLTLVSAWRSFDYQRDRLWNPKMQFNTSVGTFGVFQPTIPPVSTRCAHILTPADQGLDEWNTSNENHGRCWMALTEEERALEVLKTSSAPGTSRHHWGTDIDLNSLDPEAWERPPLSGVYSWLTSNAATYGFYQPYTPRQQRGNIGYFEEKWHWSYTAIAQPLLSEYQRLLFNPSEFQSRLQGRNVETESFIVSHYQEYVGSVAQPSLLPETTKDNRPNSSNSDSSQIAKGPNKTSPVTSNLEIGINSVKGGGQTLSDSLRAFYEPRFGHNFGQVRLHADSQAAEYADALRARAFTIGRDIFFGAGQFTPENSTGRKLLAHELTHVIQQGSSDLCIQRHVGDHSGITSPMDKYRHTFDHARISQSTWESGFISANFLGVHISGGLHQELSNRLINAETFLRNRYPGLSDSDIATRIGLRYIEGRRRPGLATGTNRISFHAFGLAIDVNKIENIYIAHSENEAEIIERATSLILGRPIDMRMDTSGMSPVELRNIYQEASDALLTYFRLLGVRHSTAMWLMIRGRLTDDDAIEELWDQISDDLAVLRRQNPRWDPLERGFIDLTQDLVEALTDSSGGGLYWLGLHRGGKDLMHFDWRSGSIRHGHRI